MNVNRTDLANMDPEKRAEVFFMNLRARAENYDRMARETARTIQEAIELKDKAELHRQLATEFMNTYWPNR